MCARRCIFFDYHTPTPSEHAARPHTDGHKGEADDGHAAVSSVMMGTHWCVAGSAVDEHHSLPSRASTRLPSLNGLARQPGVAKVASMASPAKQSTGTITAPGPPFACAADYTATTPPTLHYTTLYCSVLVGRP